jgi:hypothetical protein
VDRGCLEKKLGTSLVKHSALECTKYLAGAVPPTSRSLIEHILYSPHLRKISSSHPVPSHILLLSHCTASAVLLRRPHLDEVIPDVDRRAARCVTVHIAFAQVWLRGCVLSQRLGDATRPPTPKLQQVGEIPWHP